MKVILTIGSPQSGYETVAHLLSQAGIAQANASNKANLTPQALQEQLLRSHEVDLSSPTALAQVQPGKFWNELATDLFLSNIEQTNWGWADHQTALLMDFWHDFDAQVRLLLIYNSPAKHLERVLNRKAQPTVQTITVALDDWVRWNTVLLRYLHRHPDYCVLVNGQQATDQQQFLLEKLSEHWQLNMLNVPAANPTSDKAYQHLQAHLINQLIDKHHPALALYQELEGASFLLTNQSAGPVESHMGNPYGTWADWVYVSTQLTELEQNNAALTHASEKASERNTGLQQESENLLLQLHEVQQELETYFIKNETLTQLAEQAEHITRKLKDTQTQRDALVLENESLSDAREIATQAKSDALEQLDAVRRENIALTHASEKASERNTGLQQECENLLLQLHEVQQELETYFIKNETLTQLAEQAEHITRELKDTQTQRDALVLENESLSAAREIATQAKSDALEQLDSLTKENITLTQSNDKVTEVNSWLKQESEQLLLQLHEVQQELEQYYLLHQQVKNESDLKTKTAGFSTDFWRRHQPQELVIDLQHDIAGSNWYPFETEGRWAGPAMLSTLQIPPLQTGDYILELDIVDAMNLGIVNGLVIEAFNQAHPVEVSYPLYKGEYPLVCKVPISIAPNVAAEPWLIGLRFPQLVSPGDSGSDDKRNLAIRLRSLRLVKQS